MPTLTKSRADDIVIRGNPDDVKAFMYRARTPEGKVVQGTAKALAPEDVTNELLRRGLVPLKISGGAGSNSILAADTLRRSAKKRDLVIASRMLAAMLDSGLPYVDALEIVHKDTEDPLLANAFNEMRIAAQNGSSLTAAIEAQGPVFPPIMRNMIATGEISGTVKEAMNRVADQLDREDQLRAKIKKAMTYPMMVLAVSGAVFAFMMLYLVPMFTDTYLEIGGEDAQLPGLTRAVVAVSDFATYAIPVSLVLAVPGFLWYRSAKDKVKVREFVDPLKLKVPVFGVLFHKIALARFTQTLSGLLNAGVERLQALEITAETCGNIAMERAIMAARDAQRDGRPLVDPLRAEPLFEGKVIGMVEAGEKSGRTGYMLGKLGDLYDRDVDTLTDSMSELIQPLFMGILGVMVGVMVIAIYLPYMKLGDVIDQGQ